MDSETSDETRRVSEATRDVTMAGGIMVTFLGGHEIRSSKTQEAGCSNCPHHDDSSVLFTREIGKY